MREHYERLIRDTEERVIHALRVQETKKESPYYGGFYDANRMVQAKVAIYQVLPEIECYLNKDTKFYKDEKVYKSLILGFDYIRACQHENGLFDYVTCNFNSAPDTAFCILEFLPVIDYLHKVGCETDKEKEILSRCEAIVHDGIYGMLEGGFHTPNHRWAIAGLLAKGFSLYGDKKLLDAANEYLKEGIDCNEDGEYAEKSAGNYNRVNNDAMIMLSESLNDDQYDANVVRNLELMLMYWEPDWSVFTANSTRFDKDRLCFPEGYYLEYMKMGLKYDNPVFLSMCSRIIEICKEYNLMMPDILIWFMLRPEFVTTETGKPYEQHDFKRFCKWSGIYRAKKGNFSYTVMNGKSNFLYFHDGTVKLAMKVAGSFCEHRAFVSETMEEEDGGLHLHQTMHGWYYLPYPKDRLPNTSDWWQMENTTKRPKKYGPDVDIDVYVKEVEGGLDVRVVTKGIKGAPWRIELAFTGIDYMQSEHLAMPVTGAEVLVCKDGTLEAYNNHDSVTVGPCFGEHRFTEGKEDSEAKTAGAATLYLTDYTEFDRTIQIRNKRDCEGY